MEQRRVRGTNRLRASIVASALLRSYPDIYKRVGVKGMKQYVEEATSKDIFLPSQGDNDNWLELAPNVDEAFKEIFPDQEREVTHRQVGLSSILWSKSGPEPLRNEIISLDHYNASNPHLMSSVGTGWPPFSHVLCVVTMEAVNAIWDRRLHGASENF